MAHIPLERGNLRLQPQSLVFSSPVDRLITHRAQSRLIAHVRQAFHANAKSNTGVTKRTLSFPFDFTNRAVYKSSALWGGFQSAPDIPGLWYARSINVSENEARKIQEMVVLSPSFACPRVRTNREPSVKTGELPVYGHEVGERAIWVYDRLRGVIFSF